MTPSEISDEEFWEGEHAEDDNRRKDHVSQIRQSIRSKMTNPEAQKDSVDDVPMSIKRALELPMEDETEPKKVKESLIAGVMAATLDNSEHASAWMTRDELQQLRRILAIPGITAARVHKGPSQKAPETSTGQERHEPETIQIVHPDRRRCRGCIRNG